MNKLYRDTVTLYHADTAAQTVVLTLDGEVVQRWVVGKIAEAI